MKKTISIPEWHQMAENGDAPPVRIQLNGSSMFPLVRMNRDYVTVVPLNELPVIGDIVMFCEPDTGRYVVHRVWEMKEGQIRTWGDQCAYPDRWMSPDAIWGKVTLIERGKRKIITDPDKGMRWAKIWHHFSRPYRIFDRYRQAIMGRVKKWT